MYVKNLFTTPVEPVLIATSKCYDAAPSMRAVINCVKRGHLSVLRHGYSTFEVKDVSRALLQQLARHHHLDLTVRSQRYCDEEEFTYAVPPSIMNAEPTEIIDYDTVNPFELYCEAMKAADRYYRILKLCKIPKEDARMVLPNACCTQFAVSGNWQAWFEFLQTRLSKRAQWEIRMMAEKIHSYFLEHEQLRDVFSLVEPKTT